jgi:hypothetical protein
MGPWERADSAQERDVAFYKGACFDPAINKLHWFLCAFEGAALVRNSDLFPDYPLAQRQPIADTWFSAMFQRFKSQGRLSFGSGLTPAADAVCAKLHQSTGQMSFQDMLAEITKFMAMSSADNAQRYFDFWNAMINKPKNKTALAPPPLLAAG